MSPTGWQLKNGTTIENQVGYNYGATDGHLTRQVVQLDLILALFQPGFYELRVMNPKVVYNQINLLQ